MPSALQIDHRLAAVGRQELLLGILQKHAADGIRLFVERHGKP